MNNFSRQGIALANCSLGFLLVQKGQFEMGISLLKKAFNCGVLGVAESLFRIYSESSSNQDLIKAYYWSAKAPKLGVLSYCVLDQMLVTGKFEWTQHHHHYWSRLNKIYLAETNFSHQTTFTDQVFVILLISKVRALSRFKFANYLNKNVGLSIIKQLAHLCVFNYSSHNYQSISSFPG